jgi:hypothetical protein
VEPGSSTHSAMSHAPNRIRNQWRQPRVPPEIRGHAMTCVRNLSLCRSSVSRREHCARVNLWLGNMKRGHPALRILFILCVAAFCLGIRVDAYAIPFSFTNSADIVNKVCLHPCREIGLEKGTRVTVDFTLSNADSGAEGDYISQLLQ